MAEPLPAKVNLTLYRGDTRVWTDIFTETVADAVVPKDLTGYTFLSQIRDDKNRGEIVATIAVEADDPAAGTIVRTLTAEEADKLPGEEPGQAAPVLYWDLQSTKDGMVRTWMAGSVKVKGDATDV